MDSFHSAQTSDSTMKAKKALVSAIGRGVVEDTIDILQEYPELVTCEFELTEYGFSGSPLLFACDNAAKTEGWEIGDHYGIVDYLLEQGSDPNCVGYSCRSLGPWLGSQIGYRKKYYSITPLVVAALYADKELLETLLFAGANINQTNTFGQTALHISCIHGNYRNWIKIKHTLIIQNADMYNRNWIEIRNTLLSHCTDKKIKDVHGRTALHYFCENIETDTVNDLMEVRQMNVVDSRGFTALELATQSHNNPFQILQKLYMAGYLKEALIEAYETTAWSLLWQDTDKPVELGPVVHCMTMATFLRMGHNIPKKVSDPLECYGFAKEWETMEDLSKIENSLEKMMLQALLSREQIFRRRHRSGPLLQYISYHRMLASTKQQLNALLIHFLHLYEESLAMMNLEGYMLITSIGFTLATWFSPILSSDYQSQHKFEDVDTNSITKTVKAITGACLKMKLLLEGETRVTLLMELVDSLSDCVFILTGIIMKLYKRKRSIPGIHVTEESLAKQMLRGVISQIGNVVSHPINFQRPVQNIIIMKHMDTSCKEERFDRNLFKDDDIYEVLVDSIHDIDATDGGGNMLLLLVAQQFHEDKSPNTLKTLDFLIGQGAYTYAKNSEGKTILDYLSDRPNALESRTLEMLRSKIPSLQTLAAIRAKDKNVPLTGDISDSIKRFIELH